MSFSIRPLTTLEDCRRVAALEREVWGYADAEDVVPAPVLIVSVKRGGILLGAFDADNVMKGFVYSMPAIKEGRPTQWSHMLGVTADVRSTGLGARLKLAQRQVALQMGLELIEWTFDPLQALNAHLNFAKLGVVASEYEENVYGESSSPLHRGTPTDRLIAEWHIRQPHVERRLFQPAQPAMRDASISSAPVVNPAASGLVWIRPGRADLSAEVQPHPRRDSSRFWRDAAGRSGACAGVAVTDAGSVSEILCPGISRRGFLPGAQCGSRALPAGAHDLIPARPA